MQSKTRRMATDLLVLGVKAIATAHGAAVVPSSSTCRPGVDASITKSMFVLALVHVFDHR